MDAFDEGIVTTSNFAQARRLITARAKGGTRRQIDQSYTVKTLQEDIADVTKVKTSYVREAKTKENRFMTLLGQLNLLWQDPEFVQLLREESLCDRPDLSGDFSYES
jgi:ParB family chromosome partitioning protein